jgi:hypothetical protein
MGKDHPKRRAIGQAMVGSGAGLILLCAILGLAFSVFALRGGDTRPLAGVIFGGAVSAVLCLGPVGLLGLLTVLAGAALWVWSEP